MTLKSNRAKSEQTRPNALFSEYRQSSQRHTWGWLILCCALITLIVCIFSFVGTFGLLPERVMAGGESMLVADYSLWQGYEPLNLDVVRLATAAAQGDAPWQSGFFDVLTAQSPATAIQITSQVSPLPTLTPTDILPTHTPVLRQATNTLPPTIPPDTATAVPTNPPPPPPTSPPPTSPPPATNTPPPPATDTPTITLTPTSTETPTQVPPPPEVNVNQPPDGTWLELCSTPLIIDLGGKPIGVPGSALVYYERYYAGSPPGVHMDPLRVEVCPDLACSSAYQVFLWGDGNSGNNGSIPASYYPPETAALFIPATDMYDNSGIMISMGGVPNGVYQFVRISAPPSSDCASDSSHNVQIDALVVTP